LEQNGRILNACQERCCWHKNSGLDISLVTVFVKRMITFSFQSYSITANNFEGNIGVFLGNMAGYFLANIMIGKVLTDMSSISAA
jgi:hypothetical protein